MPITDEPVGSTFRNLGGRFNENLNRTMRRRKEEPNRRGFAGEQNPQDAAAAPSISRRNDADMENRMPQPRLGREVQAPGGAPGVNTPEGIPQPQAPGRAPPRVNAPTDVSLPQTPGRAPPRVEVPGDALNPRQPSGQPPRLQPPAPVTYESEVGGVTGSSVPRRTDSNIPVPVQALREEARRRAPSSNTRSTTRMSPRRESDELNEIAQSITARRGGAEMEPGRTGDIARRISNRAAEVEQERQTELAAMKRGGPVKKMAKGGVVSSSASSRSDGCVTKGRTKGRMV